MREVRVTACTLRPLRWGYAFVCVPSALTAVYCVPVTLRLWLVGLESVLCVRDPWWHLEQPSSPTPEPPPHAHLPPLMLLPSYLRLSWACLQATALIRIISGSEQSPLIQRLPLLPDGQTVRGVPRDLCALRAQRRPGSCAPKERQCLLAHLRERTPAVTLLLVLEAKCTLIPKRSLFGVLLHTTEK